MLNPLELADYLERILKRRESELAEWRELIAYLRRQDENGHVLAVPYLSQWGMGADQRRGDCGPACIGMLAHFLTPHRPTVDRAAAACGQPATGPGQAATSREQLRRGAASYGITLETRSVYRPPALTLDLLKAQVDAGKPAIALIHYGVLRDGTNGIPGIIHNQDQKYARGHWVVFCGYTDSGVVIQDPDFYGNRVNDGNLRYVPLRAFEQALAAVAPGCTVGNQGLIVT